jgi:hypothetical protein
VLRRNLRGGQFALARLLDIYVACTIEKTIRHTLTAFCEDPSQRLGARSSVCEYLCYAIQRGDSSLQLEVNCVDVGHLAARVRTWILYVLCGRRVLF